MRATAERLHTLVVIPNWNGRQLVDCCLASLRAQTFRDFRVVVVDNGSSDGSQAQIRERFPEVHLICNDVNRGFAAAVNQGIRAIDSSYVVVLNNDTEASPAWLQALVDTAVAHPDVGSFASRMLLADGDATIDGIGICVDRLGFAWDCCGGARDDEVEQSVKEVFGASGGAALFRRQVLDEIGLFDEDFFAYLEDVDLAWRAQSAGWRSLSVPEARILHRHSATAREGSPFKSFQLGRNKVWLLVKNYPLKLWYLVPLVLLYDVLAVLYALVARGDAHALRGRMAGWAGAREMWHKRQTRPSRSDHSVDRLAPPRWPWTVYRQLSYLKRLRT